MSDSDPLLHRRSIRLRNWDYSSEGAYFVTICTHERELTLGHIENDRVILSQIGDIVAAEWTRTFEMRPNYRLDYSVVMPNHFHGIVVIADRVSQQGVGATCGRPDQIGASEIKRNGPGISSLGSAIGGFKSAVTSRCRKLVCMPVLQVWQRNYHEHIIRNENELFRCREYIENNPLKWTLDRYYRAPEDLGL